MLTTLVYMFLVLLHIKTIIYLLCL